MKVKVKVMVKMKIHAKEVAVLFPYRGAAHWLPLPRFTNWERAGGVHREAEEHREAVQETAMD